MAIPDKIISEKIKLLEQSPEKLISGMSDVQKELFKKIQDALEKLDIVEGKIVTSKKNVDAILRIQKEIKKAFAGTEYAQYADEFITDIKKTKTLNLSYFKKVFGNVKEKTAQIGYEANKAIIEEQVFGSETFNSVLFNPLKKQILEGVTNGVSFKDLISNIETFVIGNEKKAGVLEKYTKQIANDAFATIERNYTSQLADSLNIQFVRYTGGLIADSRCFCEQRNGKYFHIEEVRAWGGGDLTAGGIDDSCDVGDGTWQGMYIGTNSDNIEQWLGGYNCKHSIIFVSEINVPDEVKERAKKKGYYKPKNK